MGEKGVLLKKGKVETRSKKLDSCYAHHYINKSAKTAYEFRLTFSIKGLALRPMPGLRVFKYSEYPCDIDDPTKQPVLKKKKSLKTAEIMCGYFILLPQQEMLLTLDKVKSHIAYSFSHSIQ